MYSTWSWSGLCLTQMRGLNWAYCQCLAVGVHAPRGAACLTLPSAYLMSEHRGAQPLGLGQLGALLWCIGVRLLGFKPSTAVTMIDTAMPRPCPVHCKVLELIMIKDQAPTCLGIVLQTLASEVGCVLSALP